MRKADWIALGVIGVAAYFLVKSKKGGTGGGTALDVVSGNAIVGFMDTTQQVQYDPATGNLWDVSGSTNVLISTITPGQGATVFADPSVQSLIAQWKAMTGPVTL